MAVALLHDDKGFLRRARRKETRPCARRRPARRPCFQKRAKVTGGV